LSENQAAFLDVVRAVHDFAKQKVVSSQLLYQMYLCYNYVMWLFYTLLATLLWGVGQIFTKKGLTHLPPLFNNVLSIIVLSLTMLPFALIHGVQFQKVISLFPWVFLVTLFLFCYYYAIGVGQISLTGTIMGSYPFVTVLLSLLLLHEKLNIFQTFAIFLIISGTILLAIPDKNEKLKGIKIGRWFWIALASAVSIGMSDFVAKVALNNIDIATYFFTYVLTMILIVIISLFFDKKGRNIPKLHFKKYIPTIIGVTMAETGMIPFYVALSQGLASLVVPLSSFYVAITAFLAWIVLKEKINKIQCLGITLSVIGVILIGIIY